MRGHSHLIIGGAIGAVIATHTGAEILGIAAGAFGALTPDIDHPGSMLGRWFFFWPSIQGPKQRNGFQKNGRRGFAGPIWHRGQLHSLGFVAIVAVISGLLYALAAGRVDVPSLLMSGLLPLFVVCITAGALSHLAADCVNKSPMMLFWPISHKLILVPIPHAKQDSARGQMYEIAVVVMVLVLAFYLVGGNLSAFQGPAAMAPYLLTPAV